MQDIIQDRVSFNTEAAAGQSREDFIAEHQGSWPDITDEQRNDRLGRVWDAAKQAVAAAKQEQTSKTLTNGNSTGNAQQVQGTGSGTDSGNGDKPGPGKAGGSKPAAAQEG